MARISLSQARAGQEVTRPVVNNNGVVLVQAGARLNAPLIERLRSLGISFIVVAGPDPSGPARSPAEVAAEVEARFAGHESDPLMQELKRIVLGQAPQAQE